jgi:hypothetical protein
MLLKKRVGMRTKATIFFLNLKLLVILLVAGCGFIQQNPHQNHVPNSNGNLDQIIAAITPQGWKIHDRILWFTPENLYQLINGRAEFYLAYDVLRMNFTRFEKNDDSDIFINVSVYDMGTPTNAFGVFSTERPEVSKELKIGRGAYRSGTDYYIWKGRYYIHIIPYSNSIKLQPTAMELAEKLGDLLWDSGEPVWGLSALPKENLVRQSVRYYLVDAMALDFMKNTYLAEYKRHQTHVTVFLSRRDSVETARDVITAYAEHANLYGRNTEQLNINGAELMSFDMGGIYDVVFQKGTLVAGVTEAQDRDVAIQAAVDLWRKLKTEE